MRSIASRRSRSWAKRTPVRSSRPAALDPDRRRPADHDLVDRGVAQQRLQRAEAERALGDPLGELGARVGVEHRRLAVHERADPLGRGRPPAPAGVGEQAVAQVGGELVEIVHRG